MYQENIDNGLQIAEIFKLYGNVHTYSPGEMIFQRYDSANELYYIVKGRVRAYLLSKNGDEITLFYINEKHTFGSEIIANIQLRTVSVDSVTDSKLYSIDANTLMENCKKSNISTQNLMESLINKIIMLSDLLCCARFIKNEEKLAYFLYSNCDSDENVVKYTHEQIASVTGMNRVSVTKSLNSFVEKGLISKHYKKITVLNKDGLADIFNSIGYSLD